MASYLRALAPKGQTSVVTAILVWVLASYPSAIAGGSFPQATQNNQAIPESAVQQMERKLLCRVYSNDPLDKRLQRLELLVFGATQFGSDKERWAQLQRTVAEQAGKGSPKASTRALSKKGNNANNEGPAIDLLEKEILKKTFANELPTKRLDRLEAKVFGQASPNMPSTSRIDRLRKATGLPAGPEGPQTAIRPYGDGTMPNFPLGEGINGDPFSMLPQLGGNDPQISEMVKEMQRQMRQFDQFGMPGTGAKRLPNMPNMPKNGQYDLRFYYLGPDGKPYEYHLGTPDSNKPFGGLNPSPNANPGSKDTKKSPIPGLKVPDTNQIPPYGDPNMI
jgi:hypothetical protein